MSNTPSELMMNLLKELALLKQLDEKHENGVASGVEAVEVESRENRRREIAEQIKALGGPLA